MDLCLSFSSLVLYGILTRIRIKTQGGSHPRIHLNKKERNNYRSYHSLKNTHTILLKYFLQKKIDHYETTATPDRLVIVVQSVNC